MAQLFYNQGSYDSPPLVHIPFEEFTAPEAPTGNFVDAPMTEIHRGTMLIDATHRNRFNPQELSVLTSRVANRGYQVAFLGDFSSTDESERLNLLKDQLRQADSLVVALPQESYSPKEIAQVEQFVEKGGKLLLIADPTRRHDISSLAKNFGINFQADYLYNLVDNDLNYQEVFLREFQPDELTRGLQEIAVYSAGSVKSSGVGLAFSGTNTRSTFAQKDTRFYPFARGEDRNVVALYDLTFMVPPHNTILDNDRLVSNIADYLTTSQRDFELTDFPRFFNGEVDLLLSESTSFEQGTEFKKLLAKWEIGSEFKEIEDRSQDTVFLGTYEDSSQVSQYLDSLGVHVDGELQTPFTPTVASAGTGTILLHQSLDRDVLVVLGDSSKGLTTLISRIRSGTFRDGLVDDFVGVYKTE
ncbi:MAG: hypothetical protein ACE5Q6_03555 [Dehalococcoidia bacterium]